MTNFKAKHDELYLEELKSVTKKKIFNQADYEPLILELSFNKNNGYKILEILYFGLKEEQIQNVLNIKLTYKSCFGYVRNIIFDELRADFIDFLFQKLTKDKLGKILNICTYDYKVSEEIHKLFEIEFINFLFKNGGQK